MAFESLQSFRGKEEKAMRFAEILRTVVNTTIADDDERYKGIMSDLTSC